MPSAVGNALFVRSWTQPFGVVSPEEFADRYSRIGFRWICLVLTPNTAQVVRALRARGIYVSALWLLPNPATWRNQIETHLSRVREQGAQELMIDPEVEWRNQQTEASLFMARLEASGIRIVLTSYGTPQGFPWFPWTEFRGSSVTGVPQLYDRDLNFNSTYFTRGTSGWNEKGFNDLIAAGSTWAHLGSRSKTPEELSLHLSQLPNTTAKILWAPTRLTDEQIRVMTNWNNGTLSVPSTLARALDIPPSTAGAAGASSLPVPENDILERISSITSDRTEPPNVQHGYYTLSGSASDPQSGGTLTQEKEAAFIFSRYDRFYDQVMALKETQNIKMSECMPIIEITTEDENGRPVKLNELIFGTSTFEGYFSEEEYENNPERPLASIDQFQVHVQPTQYGATSLSQGELSLKIHNPEMVHRSHPRGKYLAFMLSQGYNLRIKYGVNGAYDMSQRDRTALQWKEEDFFVTDYRLSIRTDKTAELKLNLMPNTQKLLNHIFIGESIPASEISNLTSSDIEDIVSSVVSSDRDATPAQTEEIRRRIRALTAQFNSERESVGLRTISYGSGTFGSVLHGAISNSRILENQEGITPVPIENMVEALQTVQAVLLTRRHNETIRENCYRYTHNSAEVNAVNFGALFWILARPELDLVLAYASQNNMQVGELFSLDDDASESAPTDSTERRDNVNVIFGNFNPRAGQWADKPISMFPINIDDIFALFRERRNVGEFSCKFNQFCDRVFSQCREFESFSIDRSSASESTANRIEIPEVRYEVYKNPIDPTSWIFYIYDNKMPLVRFRNAVDAINDSGEGAINKEQVYNILNEQKIAYFEMGEEGSFLRELGADTISDDTIASNNIFLANRAGTNIRNIDGATEIPAGVSRDFMAGDQFGSQATYRSRTMILPLQVSLDAYVIPTVVPFIPIFIFFPVRTFSGIYIAQNVTHQITKSRVMTKINLISNLSVYNTIPL